MATIDTLTLDIKADASKASREISGLIDSLGKLKRALPSHKQLERVGEGFKSIYDKLSGINATNLEPLTKMTQALEGMKNVPTAKRITSVAQGFSTITNAVNSLSDESIARLERMNTALSNMPRISSGQVRAMSSALPSVSQAVSSGLTSTGAAGAGGNQIQNQVGSVIGSLRSLRRELNSLRPVWNAFSHVAQRALAPIRRLLNSIIRISIYRAIRSAIKAVTKAIKEGLQNLALYSKAMEGLDTHNANDVMSRLASSFLYLKNAIATAFMPVLRALTPMIEEVVKRLVDFINVIAQIGSAFFGSTFTKAKYFWVDYADSLDTATGSAKKLHHQLAGFDELNNLTDNSGSGSDKLKDASQMFEKAEINPKIKAIVDKVKEAFEDVFGFFKKLWNEYIKPTTDKLLDMWGKVWEKVSPNLKRIYDSLKKIWDKALKPFIEGFVKGFGEGLYGEEIESIPELFELISDKVADAVEKLAEFFDNMDVNKVKDFAEKVGKVVGWIIKMCNVVTNLITLYHAVTTNIDSIRNSYVNLSNYLNVKFVEVMGFVKTKIHELLAKIREVKDGFISAFSDPIGVMQGLGQALYDTIQKAKEDVMKIINLLIEAIKRAFSGLKGSSSFLNIFSPVIENVMALISWLQTAIDKINVIKNTKISVPNTVTTIVEGAAALVEGANKIVESTKRTQTTSNTTALGTIASAVAISSHKRANGGFVPQGDLFIANEQGAEMIGSVNNRTAVANNEMITEAIANATYEAMSRALSENNGNVTITVEGDGDRMFRVFQKKQREYQRSTGLVF